MNKEEFLKSLSELNIKLTSEQLSKLNCFAQLLIAENKKYNLTSITDINDIYLKHYFDSLTMVKIIKLNNQSLCDIGTGAGFPGIVLKIVFPNIQLTLVESNKKKCNFLEKVINTLNLKNVEIINERAEEYSKYNREKYDIVTSRAVAPLKHLLEYSIPLVKINGFYIAMKSNITNEIKDIEIYESKLKIKQIDLVSFNLPQENSLRTLIKYQKIAITDKKFPRKYSDIKKKSL